MNGLSTIFNDLQLITFPAAHLAVRPIRRLHEATKRCGRPPEYREEPKKRHWWSPMRLFDEEMWRGRGRDNASISGSSQISSGRRDNFRIPQKVPVGKHLIHDELTSLVGTFNTMTDELLGQYEKLEEKVRDRTEQLQQQTVLAESANEAKTMFIANVSHELRTPLNGILGMCSLVLEENNLPTNTRENLEVVFKSGQLLLHLLTDLITFSKNQVWGAQLKLENGPFRIRDFVTQVMALFGNQAKDKNIELTCEVFPTDGIDCVLIGDLNRILQVVINLISNSLKFTKEAGCIELMIVLESMPNAESIDVTPFSDGDTTDKQDDYLSAPIFFKETPANILSTETISPSPSSPSSPGTGSQTRPTRPPLFTRGSTASGLANTESEITKTFLNRSKKLLNPETAADPDSRGASRPTSPSSNGQATHMVEFRVIDTGPGVPEHMQQKIFEPFVQADVGLSRKYGGTGLGLSICQQLAKLMGGDIHLKSFEGAGSTFTLRIPMHFSAQPLSITSSSQQNNRPLSLSRRSAHTATKSLSAFSGPAFSRHSAVSDGVQPGQDGNLRLVGLSQPFFVPSRAESEDEMSEELPPSLHRDNSPGKGREPLIPPVVEVTTPSTYNSTVKPEKDSRMEFPPMPLPQDGQADVVEDTEKPAEEDPNDKTIRVLMVEDNKINQKLVVKVLQLEGVKEITVAEDGIQAVERVQEFIAQGKKFDIIFMDIQVCMPLPGVERRG
jgi:osomolarity two-component system sensor histidine kinase SLN1